MTSIRNLKTIDDESVEINADDGDNKIIDGSSLTIIPALIDPHVHFRVPGQEHKEDWMSATQATIAGGVTTVFDMPNNNPSVIDRTGLNEKKSIINKQLFDCDIALNYHLYLGATANNADIYESVKKDIVGIKIFMGSSTGDLLVDKKQDQARIFQMASRSGLVVAVHAEDEQIIKNEQLKYKNSNVQDHSKIRHRQAAIKAVSRAIELAKQYDAKLYICHVTTAEEIEIIKQAKNKGIKVYAEATPHHLFLDESHYNKLGTKAQMNPPLRTASDCRALWQAINDGVIDTIGTDHAPHTLQEKNAPYLQSPSGVPGIETCLPLLLDAYNKGIITLEKIVELTHTNINKIFGLTNNNDKVIVDLNLIKEVKNENLKTKCKWSPFNGWKLKGWPTYTILKNQVYKI
ncbi:MAG: dihydroorotase [bacterium]